MPHIDFKNDFPGIRAAMAYRPETAAPMGVLAEILLRSNEGLSRADRELIGTYVSHVNDCFYCDQSHGAIACIYLNGDNDIVEMVRKDFPNANISDKLKSLLAIAGKVAESGKSVTAELIEKAKQSGATDLDIHDTVLIAAAFCMFNRYVDGLATVAPSDMDSYPKRAQQIVEKGYGNHVFTTAQPT